MLFGKPFQDEKTLIRLISLLKFSSEHILFAQAANEVIHDVFHFHKMNNVNVMLSY